MNGWVGGWANELMRLLFSFVKTQEVLSRHLTPLNAHFLEANKEVIAVGFYSESLQHAFFLSLTQPPSPIPQPSGLLSAPCCLFALE